VSKRWKSGLVAAVVAGALAVAGCGKSDSTAVPAPGASGPALTVKPTDIVKGNPNAPILMVEYASMTCPHCSRWQKDVMPKLMANYIKTGKVRYVFREFPLDGAARMAAALARCQQGDAYHAMIDHLFLNQEQWIQDFTGDGKIGQEDVVKGLAQMGRVAGLSEQQVAACAADPKNLAIVDANLQEGASVYNVNSTPTFIAGGVTHVGEWKWEDLDKTLKELLAKQS
jgi:protein-disulfide isomerase